MTPKDLRDRLVEIASEEKTAAARFEELSRRLLFELVRVQYEQASTAMAISGEVPPRRVGAIAVHQPQSACSGGQPQESGEI